MFLSLLVSALCGLILAWPFRSYDGSLPAWVALAPVFWIVARSEKLSWALLCAASFSLTWTVLCFTFLWPLAPAGMVALCLYTSLFYVAALWTVRRLARLGVATAVFGTAALWALVELLRACVPVFGFPWLLLGHTLLYNDCLRQGSDLLGVYGLSFMVAAVNACLAFALPHGANWQFALPITPEAHKEPRRNWLLCPRVSVCALTALMLGGAFIYGAVRIANLAPRLVSGRPIGVIQGNIAQKLGRSDEELTEQLRGHLELHRKLAQPARPADKPVLICWAETMVPGYINVDEWGEEFRRGVAAAGIPTLAGSNFWVPAGTDSQFPNGRKLVSVPASAEPHSYNGAFMFSGKGEETYHYLKRRLVPFGEYIPFTQWFPFLKALRSVTRDQYTPGQEFRGHAPDFQTTGDRGMSPEFLGSEYAISVNICVEDIHPDLAREAILSGSNLLINLTNDGWFCGSYGPRSHMQAAAWRAIETRCPLLRVTNTGLTVAVDPLGKVELLVPNETVGTAIVRPRSLASVIASGSGGKPRTLTLLLGDAGEALIFAGVLLCLLLCQRRSAAGECQEVRAKSQELTAKS